MDKTFDARFFCGFGNMLSTFLMQAPKALVPCFAQDRDKIDRQIAMLQKRRQKLSLSNIRRKSFYLPHLAHGF